MGCRGEIAGGDDKLPLDAAVETGAEISTLRSEQAQCLFDRVDFTAAFCIVKHDNKVVTESILDPLERGPTRASRATLRAVDQKQIGRNTKARIRIVDGFYVSLLPVKPGRHT